MNINVQGVLSNIRELLHNGKNEYIKLGYLLRCIGSNANTVEKSDGGFYKNIYELAKAEFNLCKTNVKYYIAVSKRFGVGENIKPEYSTYLFSQLREMVSLNAEQLELCNPDMTIQEIKALRKVSKDIKKPIEMLEDSLDTFSTVYLSNSEKREEFIKNYSTWELYKSIPELTLNIYRAELTNGYYIYATELEKFEQVESLSDVVSSKKVFYCFVDPCNFYSRYSIGLNSVNSVVSELAKLKVNYKKY